MGEGRFVSDIPPIVFEGIRTAEAAHEPAPASWDEGAASVVLNAPDELKGFDVESSAASVRYFAEQGAPRAKAIMDKLKVADVMVKSRDAIKKPQLVIVADGHDGGSAKLIASLAGIASSRVVASE
jgi:hypothetical protein